ncbi:MULTISPECIES: Hpt domain-containing protein [Sphingomonas]|jgi:hypothetical protein|uniref:Uncharacterized protein n=1 Tax=Sphingomonas ginsenosidimutans TaxID=862134 RepID=A0A2A4I2Q4_9SPHN|nr:MULTISPECIES: Hpt domain-containing protein [Sphingomonas]MBY0300860.1 Hpt domain-containing protein [Sphingomonas ginsenosidimutans]PCG10459.1 hypothetical protein COA17_03280 [Sphingomonas ginsenosidimutans]
MDKSRIDDLGIITDRDTVATTTDAWARDGWRVTHMASDAIPPTDAHALLLVALPPGAADAWLARWKRDTAPAASVVVALSPDTAVDPWAMIRRGWDDAAPLDDAVAAAARWRPRTCALPRLEEVFGVTEVARLSLGLRDRLAAALAILRMCDPADRATLAETAHRLAGICGILGFDDAGNLWRALAEARDVALPDVYRATRLAVAAIDRHHAPR